MNHAVINTIYIRSALATKTRLTAPIALSVVAFLLSACSSETSNSPSTDTGIAWATCADHSTLECGVLEVPVDYSATDSEKIALALTRLPSTGNARLGSLLLNPGGPGEPGVELIQHYEQSDTVPAEIRDAFHLVSFDPRGVGASGTLDCARELESQYNSYPSSSEELQELVAWNQSTADICVEKYGDYLQHLGSNNVVRDMEEIRKANGDTQLHFIGYSYGTRLASLYLELFPDTVGKLVLDAANPPNVSLSNMMKERVVERQKIFQNWLSECASIDPICEPTAIAQSLTRRFNQLLVVTDSPDPNVAVPAREEAELFLNLVSLVVAQPEVGPYALESFVRYADNYNIEELRQLKQDLDMLAGGDIFGSDEGTDNIAVFMSIACADDPERPTLDSLFSLSDDSNVISDLFAETVLPIAAICSGWPESIDPVQAFTQPSAGGSLIIGGIADDETPLTWAQQLAEATGAALIVSEHLGHTVTFTGRSACVDQAVIAFLTGDDGAESKTCSPSP